jgi:uncharacterized protein YaiL (DUF2058 family)
LGNSLQDQLKRAGLVNEKQVKQARKAKSKQAKQSRNAKADLQDKNKQRLNKVLTDKAEHDRQLNLERDKAARSKAIAAEVKQLIKANLEPMDEGDTPYHFTDGKKIKSLHVSEQLLPKIVGGQLAIVRIDSGFGLVPAAVAEKIRERDASVVAVLHDPGQQEESDDDYSRYKVPDDLMW